MAGLDEKMQKEKEKYLNYIAANKDKHLLIYGAGKHATQVADFFIEKKITFDGFCVTDKEANKKEERGLPIYQIDELSYNDNEVAFVIGVREQLNDEIAGILKKQGYTNYLEASGLIRYIGTYGYNFYTNPMIEITTVLGCAVNCKYCPQEVFIKEYLKADNPDKVLSFENYKKCVDKLPKNTLIEFAGFTEPFFNPSCIDMIKYAKEQGYKVNMFTTLRGVTKEILEQLLLIQFEEFVLHVPDDEGYANIPITEEYLELLRCLARAKKPSGVSYIDNACAQGTVPEVVKHVLGEDVRIYVVLNDRAGNLKDENLYCKKKLKGKLRCELAQDINHNVLLPDGRVVLCSNDWAMKHVLGNLLEQSYEDIIYGQEAKAIRRAMNDANDADVLCRDCFQAICVQ